MDKIKDLLPEFLSNFKIKIKDWRLTILFPFSLAIIFLYIIIVILDINLNLYEDFTIFERIISSFIKPLIEEVIFRGLLLGVIFISLPKIIYQLMNKKINVYFHYFIIIIGLFLQTWWFALQHENPNLSSYYLKLFDGIFYGILYVVYKKNLLPSIVAHITNNSFVHFLMIYIKF